jgi:hypothetical protein
MPVRNNADLPLRIRTLHLRQFDFTKNSNLYIFFQPPKNFRTYEDNGSEKIFVSKSLTDRRNFCFTDVLFATRCYEQLRSRQRAASEANSLFIF